MHKFSDNFALIEIIGYTVSNMHSLKSQCSELSYCTSLSHFLNAQFGRPSICWRVPWSGGPSPSNSASCSCLFVSLQLHVSNRMIASKTRHFFWQQFNFTFKSTRSIVTIRFNYSFIGISGSILATSYVKWIDVWMIFTMVVPFLEASIFYEFAVP